MKFSIIFAGLVPFLLHGQIVTQDTLQPASGSVAALENAVKVKKNGVAFLGMESIAGNSFQNTLEERVYFKLSRNRNAALEDRDFLYRIRSRGFAIKKLISPNEAASLMRISGDRIYVSGEIRDFRIATKHSLGFLPWGRVHGEITCYLQVLDALESKPCFAGNLKFIGEMDAGYVGFGGSQGAVPLSPDEEKHFVFELVNGMGDTFARTAEAAYAGIIGKKK